MRKKGGFEWNTNPEINKTGELITSRLPESPKEATDFTPCPDCGGYYAKTSLRHHYSKCLHKKDKNSVGQGSNSSESGDKSTRSLMARARAAEGRIHHIANEKLRKFIFPVLRDDTITRGIRFDWLLIIYGNKLSIKYPAFYHESMIRSKLRLAGRLLTELKANFPHIHDYSSIFQPKLYDSVIQAIRFIGEYNELTNSFNKPSTAGALVTQVKQIGAMLVSEFIKQENPEKQLRTENFLKLINEDASATILRAVMDAIAKMRRERIERLPTTEDVKLLSDYLDRERKTCFARLQKGYTYKEFCRLCELTLVSILVFNRRRTGESQNILVTDFQSRAALDEQMMSTLSDEDKKIALKYLRMKIRGKKGRTVPVLLDPHVDRCLTLIIHHRKDAKISDENGYLFGLPTNSLKRVRRVEACKVLKKFASECGAKHPETLRATLLRKHIASAAVGMDLNNDDVSGLADHMGHHEQVHRDHYRKNPITREIVQISKLLKAALGDDCNDDNDDEDDEEEQQIAWENANGNEDDWERFNFNQVDLKEANADGKNPLPYKGQKRKRGENNAEESSNQNKKKSECTLF